MTQLHDGQRTGRNPTPPRPGRLSPGGPSQDRRNGYDGWGRRWFIVTLKGAGLRAESRGGNPKEGPVRPGGIFVLSVIFSAFSGVALAQSPLAEAARKAEEQ